MGRDPGTEAAVGALFLERSRYFLRDEYRTKLRKTLDALPADALWWRPDAGSNSIGNLLLHLAGNVRQWIVAGVGGRSNTRDRAGEFAATGGHDARALWDRLDTVLREADEVLAELTAADLARTLTIQGRDMTVLGAVYHVVEHFGMHVGQIILLAKQQAPGAIRFYEDAGGLARPLWRDDAGTSGGK